jgi:hypothetical protein
VVLQGFSGGLLAPKTIRLVRQPTGLLNKSNMQFTVLKIICKLLKGDLKMVTKFRNCFVFILVFGFFIHITVQAQSIDGLWRSNEIGYEEHLGIYSYSTALAIENRKYTLMYERVSEKAMYWSSGERGTFEINNSEIIFSKEERAFGQWDLHWEKEPELIIYTFFQKDKILILIREDNVLVFRAG